MNFKIKPHKLCHPNLLKKSIQVPLQHEFNALLICLDDKVTLGEVDTLLMNRIDNNKEFPLIDRHGLLFKAQSFTDVSNEVFFLLQPQFLNLGHLSPPQRAWKILEGLKWVQILNPTTKSEIPRFYLLLETILFKHVSERFGNATKILHKSPIITSQPPKPSKLFYIVGKWPIRNFLDLRRANGHPFLRNKMAQVLHP